MSYTIYVHTNKITGKSYVGQTRQSPTLRWQKGLGYRTQPKFFRAIKKYGWDNFEHKVLAENLTKPEADLLEQQFIIKFDAIESGYNITPGGNNHNNLGKVVLQLDPSTLQVIAEYPSTRAAAKSTGLLHENIGQCCNFTDGRHFLGGFYWCYKENLTKFLGMPVLKRKYKTRPVQQLTLDGDLLSTFESLRAAENATNISHTNISRCCKGTATTAGGYKWRYK